MTPTKIRSVVAMHEQELIERGVTPRRIDPRRRLQNCSTDELLAHALYRCQHLRDSSGKRKDYSKAVRQLVVIQMCLTFAGLCTVEVLMDANRSD